MISKNESFERFHEFARKWVARVEDSRGSQCAADDELRMSIMKSWKSDLYDQLILDVTCSRDDDRKKYVVERWTIQYIPEQSRNYITTYNSLEKRLSVLTRTVYSVARLLPLFNYRRYVPPNISANLYCASNPSQGDSFVQIPPELRKFYSFPRIPLAWGAISVAVEYMTSAGLHDLVLLKTSDSTESKFGKPQQLRATDLIQARRLSGIISVPSSGPVRIPEPGSDTSRELPERSTWNQTKNSESRTDVGCTPESQPIPNNSQAMLDAPGVFTRLPPYGSPSSAVNYFENSKYSTREIKNSEKHYGDFASRYGGVQMSRSLDSQPSLLNQHPGIYLGISSNYQQLVNSRDVTQMSELASSYNSSSSGGDGIVGHAYSYGASPSQNFFPTFPGTSPPHMAYLNNDILSSSPLTGPGATFQSLRGRPNSFDHGRTFGITEAQAMGNFGSGGSSVLAGVTVVSITLEELPLSPFAEESTDEKNTVPDDLNRHSLLRGDSEDHLSVSENVAKFESDDEEEEMMFKFEGASAKKKKIPPQESVTALTSQDDHETLASLLGNVPALMSFPVIDYYENSVEKLQDQLKNLMKDSLY